MDEQPQLQPQPPTPPPTPKESKGPLIVVISTLIGGLILVGVIIVLVLTHGSSNKPRTGSPVSQVIDSSGQQYARDSKRKSDIQSIQIQLEAFFQNNGYYPNLTDMNSFSWRGANMKTLDPGALADPLSSCDPAKTGCLVAAPAAKAYAYAVTDSSGNGCEADDTQCAKYTLTATLEQARNGSRVFSKTNLD